MRKMIGVVAAALTCLVAGYSVYLGGRVIRERQRVATAVQSIIREADPSLASISDEWIAMLLRVEDPTFWTNNGIDLSSPGAGFTTISQGLGKQVFFDQFTPGLSKLELMVLTRFALIEVVPKRDVLTAFLASAYLGNDDQGPVIGFAEGARRWFGKELGALTDREFLALVAMLPAPNQLDPRRHASANADRVARIERLIAGACEPQSVTDIDLDGCA